MQSHKAVALCCLLLCISAQVMGLLSGGNVEKDSFILASACTKDSIAKTQASICATFCRSGDCAQPALSVYSYAMPTHQSTAALTPMLVVGSTYDISIENPTIVGILNSNQLAIFACRDPDCADYNQANYGSQLKNQTYGRSVYATLTETSNLALLYTVSKPGGGFNLVLDVCRDPLCALPGIVSKHIDSMDADVDVWLGYDVTKGNPLVVVSDPHSQSIKSYTCSSTLNCRAVTRPIVNMAVNSFSLSPYQTTVGKKKVLQTNNFILTAATVRNGHSDILSFQCASDLSSCSVPMVPTVSNTSFAITSVSAITTGQGKQKLAYTTFNPVGKIVTLFKTEECVVGVGCTASKIVSHSFPVSFNISHDAPSPFVDAFTVEAQLLCSGDSGCTAIAQASNAFNPHVSPPEATNMYGINDKGKAFPILAKKYAVSKYHKPPPNITVGLYVLAGIAVGSTIIIVAWRIWVGRPPKPGYAEIIN